MHLAIPTASDNHFPFSAWLHHLTAKDVAPTSPGITQEYAIQEIARNKILEVKRAFGVTIECLEGSVWITLDGDSRDVVLSTGQTFVVDRDWRTLVQALDAARVRLVAPICAH